MLKYFNTFDTYLDADTSGDDEVLYDDDILKRDEDFDLNNFISFDLAIERIAFDSEHIWENDNDDSALKSVFNILLQRHRILQERLETTTANDILAAICITNNNIPHEDYSDDLEALTLKSEIPNAPTYDYLTDDNMQIHSAYWDDVKIVGFGRNKSSPFPAYNDNFDPRLTFRGLCEEAFPSMCYFVPFAGSRESYNVILPIGNISDVINDYFEKYNSLLNDLRNSPWELYDESLAIENELDHSGVPDKIEENQTWTHTSRMSYLSPNVTPFLCNEMDPEQDSENETLRKKTFSDSIKDLWKTLELESSSDRDDSSISHCYDLLNQQERVESSAERVPEKIETECQAIWPSQLYSFGPLPNITNANPPDHAHEDQEWTGSSESHIESDWTARPSPFTDNWACVPCNKDSVDDRCLFQFNNQPRQMADQSGFSDQQLEPDPSKRCPEWIDSTLASPDVQENNSQYVYLANETKHYMHPWSDRSKSVTKSPPSDFSSQSFTDLDDGDSGQAIPVIISKSQHDHHRKRHVNKNAKPATSRPVKEDVPEGKPRPSQLSPTCEPFVPHRSKKYTADDNVNTTNSSYDYDHQSHKDQQKLSEHHLLDTYEQHDLCQAKYMNSYNGYVKTDNIELVASLPPSQPFTLERAVECDSLDYHLPAPQPAHPPPSQPSQFDLTNERTSEPSFSSHVLQESQYSEEIQYGCFVSHHDMATKQAHAEERHEMEPRQYLPMHAQQKGLMRFSCGDEGSMSHTDITALQQPPTTCGEAQFYKWQNIDIQPSPSQSTIEKQQPVTWHEGPGLRQNEYNGSNQNAGNMSMPPRHVTCVTQPSFNSNVRKVIFLTKQPTTHLQPQQPILPTPKARQTIPLQHHTIQTSQAMYHSQPSRIDAAALSRPDPYQGSRLLSGTIHHIQPSQQTRVNPAAYPSSYRTYASVATKLVVNNHGPRPYDQMGSTRTIAMTGPKYTSNMVAIPTIEGYQPGRYYGPMFNFNNHNSNDHCDVGESSAITLDPIGGHPKEYDIFHSSRKEARPIRANPANLIRIK